MATPFHASLFLLFSFPFAQLFMTALVVFFPLEYQMHASGYCTATYLTIILLSKP